MVGGALLLVGSFVLVVGHPFLYYLGLPVRDYPLVYVICGVLFALAVLLAPVGMVGFHVLQRHGHGRIGRAGFWVVVVGSLLMVLGGVVFFTLGQAGDFLQATPPLVWVVLGLSGLVVGFVGLVVGYALYGVATLKAKVLPRWCGVVFIAALPAGLASSVVCLLLSFVTRYDPLFFLSWVSTFMVLGLAWLALGHALWARREAPAVRQPRRVR